jgi:hypothetical protein
VLSFWIGCSLIFHHSFRAEYKIFLSSFGSASVTTVLIIYTEKMMKELSLNALTFQHSFPHYRLLFSFLIGLFSITIVPFDSIWFPRETYPILMIFSSSALELALTITMEIIISESSALYYLIAVESCEVFTKLFYQTLYPTRYITLIEAIMNFLGYAISIPSILIIFLLKNESSPQEDELELF